MASSEAPSVQPASEGGPGVGSGAWLGSRSVFDAPDPALRRRARNAGITSFVIHAVLGVLLIWGVIKRDQIMQAIEEPKPVFDVVYLEQRGPGGGGGGSPKPAPPKKLGLPK